MLSPDEEHDLKIYKENDLKDPQIAALFINFCNLVIRRDYGNRHYVLDVAHKLRDDILSEIKERVEKSMRDPGNEKLQKKTNERVTLLYGLYWNILLMEARNRQVDAYFLYLEKNREPKEKFYQPRRSVLLKHGIIQGFQDLIDDKLDILCISMPPGTGKAQPLYSKVLTPTGFRPMGDIHVGDKVIDGNGYESSVIGVYPQGIKSIYEITIADGSKCRCSGEHLWKVGVHEEYGIYEHYIFNTLFLMYHREFEYYIPKYEKLDVKKLEEVGYDKSVIGKYGIDYLLENIKYVGDEECQCIMIDSPCHLYITDDYIITHNTTAEKYFHSGVIGWYPKDYSLFYSHSGDITRMYYDGVYQIVTDAQEYTWGEIFQGLQVTSTNAKSQQFNVGKYKPFPSLQTTSVGAESAGKVRCSRLLLVDDMIGKQEEALNKNILDKLWNAYSVDARQRKTNNSDGKFCKEIHLATRWSVHDVIGRVQRAYEGNERVRSIAVPDIDPQTGESNFLYDYGGFTVQDFKDQELLMDEISYRCLYKQDPIEREGLLYHPDEIRTYSSLPLSEPDEVVGVCDTKNTGTDFMVLPCFYRYGDDFYLVDCVCDQGVDFDVLFEKMTSLIIEHKMQRLEIESNQGGKPIGTTLRNMIEERGWDCNITEKPTETNKETRIIANSYWVKKHILFKQKEDYTPRSDYGQLMDQLFTWTQVGRNLHDDIPDSLANFALYIQNAISYRPAIVRRSPI